MKYELKSAAAACVRLLLAAVPVAHAQNDVVTKVTPDVAPNKGAVSGYWTPERFKAAKPLPLPVVKPGTEIQAKDSRGTKPCGQPTSSDAQAPSEDLTPPGEQLFVPDSDVRKEPRDEHR
jgi:hypothetical protein